MLHRSDQIVRMPSRVLIDNGRDWDAYCFKGQTKAERKEVKKTVDQFRVNEERTAGIFNMLGIEVHFAIPYNGDSKARLERWFGTLHGQLDKTFNTYCGSNHSDRPEELKKTLKNPRKLPAFSEVQDRIAEFIEGFNHSTDHAMQDMAGYSPVGAMQQWASHRSVADRNALDMCLQMWHQPKTVGKNGVSIQVGGATLTYGYTDPALRPYKGRRECRVRISYDPWDLSSVRVYTEDWRFITEASRNPVGGGQSALTKQQVARAQRERTKYKTKRREVAQNAHHAYLSTAEIAEREASRETAQQVNDAPLKMVQTPLDQAAQDQQGQQQADDRADEREPISLAEVRGDSHDLDDDDNPVDRLAELATQRSRDDEEEYLGPINLADYPLDGQGDDDGGTGHVLDELDKEGGVA